MPHPTLPQPRRAGLSAKSPPAENFSVMVGKLPTLIGAGARSQFQNMNIERGLLWNQENAVNRGVQVNYAAGPLTLAASVARRLLLEPLRLGIDIGQLCFESSANTLAVIAGGNTSHTDVSDDRDSAVPEQPANLQPDLHAH
ncbi:outer membrane beta-barrel protein [Cupriavidus basilensis]